MNDELMLSGSQLAYLSGVKQTAVERFGVDDCPAYMAEMIPVGPGLYSLPQAFGLCFLTELRRRGWSMACALAVGKWIAAQTLSDLLTALDNGQRFALATWRPGAVTSDLDESYAPLDESQVQKVLARIMPGAVQHDLSVQFVDLLAGWQRFEQRLDEIDRPPTWCASEN